MTQTQPFSQTQNFEPQHPPPKLQTVHARLVSTISKFTFEIQETCPEVFIGRHPSCQIQVEDKHVSSKHLRIYRDEARRYFIEELGGSGCFINELLVSKGEHRALTHGDAITVGEQPEAAGGKQPFAAYIFRVEGRKSSDGANSPDGKKQGEVADSVGSAQKVLVTDTRNLVSEDWVRERWDVNHILGSGNFSEVKLGVSVKEGTKFAMKVIDKKKFTQFQSKRSSKLNLLDEADVLTGLSHKHIVTCQSWFQTEAHLYLVMELVGGGDLLQCILDQGCFTERQARRLFQQLCDAVKYLHEKNMVHRDLKPENILLDSKDRETMVAKIADFGLARQNMKSRDCRTFCGTPHYFAPEVINTFKDNESGNGKGGYDRQADLWSLGVILYILLSGIPPFEEENLYENITEAKYEFDASEFSSVSLEAKNLVRSLMKVSPKERLTIWQAVKHPWLQFDQSSPARVQLDGGMDVVSEFSSPPNPQRIDFEVMEPAAKRRKSDVSMAFSPQADGGA